MNKFSNFERETIINFNEAEPLASIYTYNKTLIRKLRELSAQRSENVKLESVDNGAYTFTVPKSWIKVHASRLLTEEQKRKAAERLKSNLSISNP